MSLEVKNTNSGSWLPLRRASCRSVNKHPWVFPGIQSQCTQVVLSVKCDLINVRFCSAFIAGRQSCWGSCFHPGKLHPPWAVHQGALPHHSDCRLSNQFSCHQNADESYWEDFQGIVASAPPWYHSWIVTGTESPITNAPEYKPSSNCCALWVYFALQFEVQQAGWSFLFSLRNQDWTAHWLHSASFITLSSRVGSCVFASPKTWSYIENFSLGARAVFSSLVQAAGSASNWDETESTMEIRGGSSNGERMWMRLLGRGCDRSK